jgi:hypothetical protein
MKYRSLSRLEETVTKIILFGGGDEGGLIITDDNVRPVPPFDPSARAQIKAVSQLVAAIEDQQAGGPDYGELTGLATRLANLAVQHVEAIVGALDSEASLIVTNSNGDGFVCGTTGRPPILLPHPPKELPPLSSMLARGGIDGSLVTFVRKAIEQGRSVEDVLERPADVARELGVELSERSAQVLETLAPSRVDKLEDPVVREVVTFFQQVLADGRYVETWAIRPAAVAQALGVHLSDQAIERIIAVGAASPRGEKRERIIWIVVGIVVIVFVVLSQPRFEARIVDRSSRWKF